MRRTRRAALGGTALVACLAATLAGCGSDPDPYVAIGTDTASGKATPPTADVTFVPLEGKKGEESGSSSPSAPEEPGGRSSERPRNSVPGPGANRGGQGHSGERGGNSMGQDSGAAAPTPTPSTGQDSGAATPTPSTAPSHKPPAPANLRAGQPQREPAAHRWCDNVTLTLTNTGGTPVRSGTVTFGTHIIGTLGIDWATIESTENLPVPIAAGATKKGTWTVCVDAWRVPLGMHVETRDAAVAWA